MNINSLQTINNNVGGMNKIKLNPINNKNSGGYQYWIGWMNNF